MTDSLDVTDQVVLPEGADQSETTTVAPKHAASAVGIAEATPAASVPAPAPEIISFPTGSGTPSVQVDAAGVPHVSFPLTKSTKATIGTTIGGLAVGAQFALGYLVPEDSVVATALKIALWVFGVAATALGIYLPTNKVKSA